jgi:hypothetical protein
VNTSHQGRDAAVATGLYAALTIGLTWPLAGGLARDIPGDFGDPLLNCWILAWDATHLFSRGWWNANIFFPHPLALAYSEHLAAQAVQILPVYALTRNPILCYNLLFLSTFVLSGLGMFLFARELSGDRSAAFVAGLAFAFAPYRISSLPHLQVLSSAWMPFVLFGFRRYFVTGRARPLVGAAAAWLLQNLSCGYYLLFFAPVVVLYLAWEVTTRRLWRNTRLLSFLAVTVIIVAAVTLPFVWPYVELRGRGFNPRSIAETRRFSADVYAYFTADSNVRVWRTVMRSWPRAEGSLFPGLTIVLLAAAGIVRASRSSGDGRTRRRALVLVSGVLLAASCATVLALLLGSSIRLPGVKITSLPRALAVTAAAGTLLLVVSSEARRSLTTLLGTSAGGLLLITVFAVVMSFGPEIDAKGRTVSSTNLYTAFYRFAPGFDGLRVPARFGMIVAFGLAALGSLGVAAIASRRARAAAAGIAGALVLLESFAAPIPINQNSIDYGRSGLAPLPDSLGIEAPAVYRFVSTLPGQSAIVELPLGEPAFDVRYMFYSTTHWKPLVNGYTGGQPFEYDLLDQLLQDALARPDRAWQAIVDSGASHAIVHEALYAGDRGPRVSNWLRASGAREVASFGPDHVFRLRQ